MPACGQTSPQDDRNFQMSIAPDPMAVRGALEKLRTTLGPRVTADILMRVELAGAEILNNIVEHAFSDGARPDGQIDLQVFVEPDELALLISDNGVPMPGGALPEASAPPVLSDDIFALPEGGFGWALIRELSDRISYMHLEGRNQLEIGFALPTG